VLSDVREGKVSFERAREVYRVVIDPLARVVDEGETVKLRRVSSKERSSSGRRAGSTNPPRD
jgi:hypothetical protein